MSKKTPKKHKSGRKSDVAVTESLTQSPLAGPGALGLGLTDGADSGSISSSSGDISGQFSPIPVSPKVRSLFSPAGGQLTGLPRKVKDSCADWHNYVQEWNVLNSKGMQCASQIANEKIKGAKDTADDFEASEDLGTVLPPGLDNLCQQLKTIHLSMASIVRKFESLTSSLKGAAALDKSQQDMSMQGLRDPLFQTWPTELFHETSLSLLGMYQQELAVKKRLVENIAHAKDRDTLMMYTSVWLHQPYIDHRATELLEGMVLETGLR